MPVPDNTAARDDFARVRVPAANRYRGLHIGMIVIGGVIGIPAFLQAAQVGASLGLRQASVAFLLGCLILGLLGALTSYVGARTRLSTYMLIEFAFGRAGARLVNMIIAVTLIGWYAVISNVFAQAADMVIQELYALVLPLWLYIVVGSGLMIAVTAAGFKGLDRLALLLSPFMLLFLIHAAWLSWGNIESWTRTTAAALNFNAAVSAVVGGYIVGVVIQPDYSRFARNIRHAVWAVFIALCIVQGLVFFLAAVPSVATGEADLIRIMLTLGIGFPAFLLLTLSSWCSNVLCLYSSGLSMNTIATGLSLRQLIIIIGIAGGALACVYSPDYFIGFLVTLGISIPPVAGIYVLNIILVRRGDCRPSVLQAEPAVNNRAFAVWLAAIIMGYIAHHGYYTLTGIAAIDAILVACILYYLLNLPQTHRAVHTEET